MLIEITEDEYKLIQRERQRAEEYKALVKKQKECKHNWVDDGHGHCHDYIKCTICGLSKEDR